MQTLQETANNKSQNKEGDREGHYCLHPSIDVGATLVVAQKWAGTRPAPITQNPVADFG